MNDSELIDDLGGPAAVAERLGYPKEGGTQRVHNWKTRGIPEVIRLKRKDVFGAPPVTPDTPAVPTAVEGA